ncbi:WD40 repeat-like protein [Xylona heveae TC161]|uniref:WD40 repeat-like protein n=1 Tax=Xylona heveae (strain CBS 132557 / TC161) TaxID=1328760 RepID=A0A164ZE34_XYLHT|nr:WD40 repeat-like protein [Xylona heveae TC161]KZF18986.1 WD40 repeat-like protein [Xylona heveae TC161]
MAAPVTHLQQIKLPSGPSPVTPEQQYWRSFRSSLNVPSPSSFSVTHISCPDLPLNPATPASDVFAVTTGTRIQLYSVRTRKLVKTISRFEDIAHSGEIRRDGRVLTAGDDTGTIQVFDVNSRAILKTWKEHKQPVWATKWSPTELTTLMSCSDDKTVRLWDLPSPSSTTTFVGHQDYVRSGAFMPARGAGLLVSGSYDQTVKIWDPRAPARAVMTFKHAAAVESVLPLPSGTTVLASADNQISVLDLVAGKPQQILRNHQKTVTSLSLASNGTRVVSGGLDGHVKIFETTGWNVVYGSKYPAPILSLNVISNGAEREDKHLAVGTSSGLLSIKTRLSGEQKIKERERKKEMQALLEGKIDEFDKKNAKKRPRGWEKRNRGKDFLGEGTDVVIEGDDRGKIKHEKKWEKDLRRGRYQQALDDVLSKPEPPLIVLTLLTALRHRSAMRAALQGRDEATLQPILRWVSKHITDPRYISIAVEVGLLIIDLYSAQMGLSPEVDTLVRDFHNRVRIEVERAQQACQTEGMLSMLTISA